MKVLVVGGTGATGRLLLRQLLDRNACVKAIVRSKDRIPTDLTDNTNLEVIVGNALELDETDLVRHLEDCEAIASCLGHNLSFRGLFGAPRRLVRDTAQRLCEASVKTRRGHPAKFVLMNTTGNHNPETDEPISMAQRLVLGLLRLLLPPHVDNEEAAEFLQETYGPDSQTIEWVIVRPDGLIDEKTVSEYDLEPAPTRSAIFNSGKTSRIQVAHFIAELIADHATWDRWKGQLPVIYHRELNQRA